MNKDLEIIGNIDAWRQNLQKGRPSPMSDLIFAQARLKKTLTQKICPPERLTFAMNLLSCRVRRLSKSLMFNLVGGNPPPGGGSSCPR
jgi:hypothetical protein